MFTVPLRALAKRGGYEEELQVPALELGLSSAFPEQLAGLKLRLEQMGTSILARGQVSAQAHLACSRCLRDFDLPLKADFAFQFEPGPASEGQDEGDGSVAFEGEDLPLGEQLRQELELCLPYRPLCREDCQGLCLGCGADLNHEACICGEKKTHGPFAGLGELIKDPKTKGSQPPII
jgi:uncharacterized protein